MTKRLGKTARGLINLYTTSMVMSFGHGMLIPTIPVIAAVFDVSIGLAAQVVTANALGRFAAPLPAGMIVDRFGARTAMTLGPIMVAAGALLTGVTPQFSLILIAMFIAGAGDSMWMIAREIAGVDLVRPDQRGRLMSGFMGVSSTGMALGPVLGGVLTELVHYRVVYFVYTALALAVLAFSRTGTMNRTLTTPHRASPAPDAGSRGPRRLSPAHHLRDWATLLKQIEPQYRTTYAVLVFATAGMMLYRMTLQSMFPLYVGSHLGYSPSQVGLLFTVTGIFVFIWIIPAGLVTDKIGRKWATVPSTAIPGIAFLALPFTDGFLQLAIIAGVLGMAQGLSLGSVATSTYDVIPHSGRGRLQALRRTIAEVGGVAGPLLGGLLANLYNPGAPFLVYGPVLILAALLLAFLAKETLVKQRAAA